MTQYTWDLDKMIAGDDARLAKKAEIEELLEKLTSIEPKKENVEEILKTYSAIGREMSTYFAFTRMKHDVDTKEATNQQVFQEAQALYAKIQRETAFYRPFILSIPEEEIASAMEKEEMKDYRLPVSRIRRFKVYTKSEGEEEILSSLSESGSLFQNTFSMLSNADMKFPTMEDGTQITQSNYVSLLENSDRAVRKEAFEKYYSAYDGHKNTFASLMYGNVVTNVRSAQLRGFSSAREASLFTDDVELSVYDNLIQAVHNALPSLHEYYEAKGRAQNIEDLHMYDVYLPLRFGGDEKIEYDTAKQWLVDAFEVLGEEYQTVVESAFTDRWIDVYPGDGKRSGAYSWGSYDSYPYIFMNYMDNLDSAFTLAHEMGHSMHSYFSRKHNIFEESSYTIFVAEVASTFNELLLLDYLNKDAKENKERKLELLNHLLNSFKSTVFRQTMFAEFEMKTHDRVEKGGTLTAGELQEIYYDLNKKYFGDAVISDEEIALEYARIPHFYDAFYVYKYATGFITSALLSKRVLDGVEGAKEGYMAFLKDGGKNFPLDQLKAAGVDLTDPKTLEEGLSVFKEAVEQFKELTK